MPYHPAYLALAGSSPVKRPAVDNDVPAMQQQPVPLAMMAMHSSKQITSSTAVAAGKGNITSGGSNSTVATGSTTVVAGSGSAMQLPPPSLGMTRPRGLTSATVITVMPAAQPAGIKPKAAAKSKPKPKKDQPTCLFCLEDGAHLVTFKPCGHSMYCQGCTAKVMSSKHPLCAYCDDEIKGFAV